MKKMISIKASFPIEVPDNWDDEMILFHLNESSSCKTNRIEELLTYINESHNGCSCDVLEITLLKE